MTDPEGVTPFDRYLDAIARGVDLPAYNAGEPKASADVHAEARREYAIEMAERFFRGAPVTQKDFLDLAATIEAFLRDGAKPAA